MLASTTVGAVATNIYRPWEITGTYLFATALSIAVVAATTWNTSTTSWLIS